jgi:hypothetical protein
MSNNQVASTSTQNLLPVQALFNTAGVFQTFVSQNQAFLPPSSGSFDDVVITNSTIDSTSIGATTPSTGSFSQLNLGSAQDLIWGAGLNNITASDGSGYFLNTDGSFIIQQNGAGLPAGPFFAVDQYGSLGLGTLFANYYGAQARCITLDGEGITTGVIDFRNQGTQVGAIEVTAGIFNIHSNSGFVQIASNLLGSMDNIAIGGKVAASGKFTDLTATTSANLSVSGAVTIASTATGTMDGVIVGSIIPNQGYFDKALSVTNADGSTPARVFNISGNGATGSGQLQITVNNAAGVVNLTPTVVGGGVLDGALVVNMGDASVSNWFFSGGDLFPSQGQASMTNGFVFIPAAAGVPTGTPTTTSGGLAALYFNQTTGKLFVYNQNTSAWVSIN